MPVNNAYQIIFTLIQGLINVLAVLRPVNNVKVKQYVWVVLLMTMF